LQNGTIINARTVEWPQMSHIKVTNEAKSFIQRCLCYNQENRADVNELYEHPYLQAKVRAQVGLFLNKKVVYTYKVKFKIT